MKKSEEILQFLRSTMSVLFAIEIGLLSRVNIETKEEKTKDKEFDEIEEESSLEDGSFEELVSKLEVKEEADEGLSGVLKSLLSVYRQVFGEEESLHLYKMFENLGLVYKSTEDIGAYETNGIMSLDVLNTVYKKTDSLDTSEYTGRTSIESTLDRSDTILDTVYQDSGTGFLEQQSTAMYQQSMSSFSRAVDKGNVESAVDELKGYIKEATGEDPCASSCGGGACGGCLTGQLYSIVGDMEAGTYTGSLTQGQQASYIGAVRMNETKIGELALTGLRREFLK
jgi:hypothetical protein